MKLDDISIAIISLIRAGAVFRFVYCMVRLQGAEEEQAQYRKRAKNTVLFYIVAESIWQIKASRSATRSPRTPCSPESAIIT